MKTIFKITILLLCVFSNGCGGPEWDYRLYVKNNSSIDIYFDFDYNVPINDTTTLYISNVAFNHPQNYKVSSFDSINYRLAVSWEKAYEKIDTVTFYIFDANVLENIPMDTVRENYFVLQKYNISLDDFEQLNWVITWPPDETMKDITMWPPYPKP